MDINEIKTGRISDYEKLYYKILYKDISGEAFRKYTSDKQFIGFGKYISNGIIEYIFSDMVIRPDGNISILWETPPYHIFSFGDKNIWNCPFRVS